MKRCIIIRPEAEQDLQAAFGWYEARVLGLGREFIRCVDATFAQIDRSPLAYPIIYKNVRRMLIRRFPYGVFYIFANEKIIVLAVFHARRDPDLWQKRN